VCLRVGVSTGDNQESTEIVARRKAMEMSDSGFSFVCMI
jgi:hypothetical protein